VPQLLDLVSGSLLFISALFSARISDFTFSQCLYGFREGQIKRFE